jgi:hypothetical protein
MDDSTLPLASGVACNRTRLAESDVAAVDACDCGLIHLHMGPFSLRLTPRSLRGLLSTLAEAIGATVTEPPSVRAPRSPAGHHRRGEA